MGSLPVLWSLPFFPCRYSGLLFVADRPRVGLNTAVIAVQIRAVARRRGVSSSTPRAGCRAVPHRVAVGVTQGAAPSSISMSSGLGGAPVAISLILLLQSPAVRMHPMRARGRAQSALVVLAVTRGFLPQPGKLLFHRIHLASLLQRIGGCLQLCGGGEPNPRLRAVLYAFHLAHPLRHHPKRMAPQWNEAAMCPLVI